MPLCSAIGCRNHGVHSFPADEKLRNQWIEAINRGNWQPNWASRLCREHFKSEDFNGESIYTTNTGTTYQRKNLKRGTVPSVSKNSDELPVKAIKTPSKLTKIETMALAETPGPLKTATNSLEVPIVITTIPDAPKLVTMMSPTIAEPLITSTTTLETPDVSTKVLETQRLTTKSLEAPKVSTKTPNPSKMFANAPMVSELDTRKAQEVVKVFTDSIVSVPLPEVPSNTGFHMVCFCCLSTNVPVVNAMKCRHNHFLKTYYQINTGTLYICINCHHMLKKIEMFRTQVYKCCNLLKNCDFLKSEKTDDRKGQVNNLHTTPVLVLTYDGGPARANVKAEVKDIESVYITEFQEDTKQEIKMETESEFEDESYFETQTYTSHTQNYIKTHKPHKQTQLSHNSVTQKYIEPTKEHKELKKVTQNNTQTQEILVIPKPTTQNYTKTQKPHIQTHIPPISVTQNHTEPQKKHINPIPKTKNNTETQANHIDPKPVTQNKIETQEIHIKLKPQTQNITKTQEPQINKPTNSTITKIRALDKKYNGKIRVLTLTEQELLKERHRIRNDEAYLKFQYKCDSCIKGFDHNATLKMHNEKHHPELSDPIFKCNICKCVHTDKRQYNAHTKAHYKRFECLACSKRSGDLPTLAYHYNTVHATANRELYSPIPLQYDCDECIYTTDSHRRYRYHKQKHKARTVCDLCNKAFVGRSAYRRHIINSHRSTTETYKCELCPRTYKLKNTLATHRRTAHTGERRQSYCTACGSTYGYEATYKAHLKTSPKHVDLKFICDHCNKMFKRKITLRQHIEWEHLKNYIHRCQQCNKLYQTTGGLASHVQSAHLNIKLPKNKICDYCGKGFSKNQQLANHLRRHTGERPLRCDRCDATFAHGGALYRHRQLIHNVCKKQVILTR